MAEEFDYCTACDEPLFKDKPYWTCEGEAFCDYCGSRLPAPTRHIPAENQKEVAE